MGYTDLSDLKNKTANKGINVNGILRYTDWNTLVEATEELQEGVAEAQSTAEAAQSTAEAAQSTADAAQSAAEEAQSTAEAAQTSADEHGTARFAAIITGDLTLVAKTATSTGGSVVFCYSASTFVYRLKGVYYTTWSTSTGYDPDEYLDAGLVPHADKVYLCTEDDKAYIWSVDEQTLVEVGAASEYNVVSSAGAIYNVTNSQPISGYYDLETAIGALYESGEAAVGMQIMFAVSSTEWVLYLYVGTSTEEEAVTDTSNWVKISCLGSLSMELSAASVLHTYASEETKTITVGVSEGSEELDYSETQTDGSWRFGDITVPDGMTYEAADGALTLTMAADTTIEGDISVSVVAWRSSGASSETLTKTLPVSTVSDGERQIFIELALGGFMYADETETVTLAVKSANGAVDYTDEYTFTVERDSGDDSSDAVWNAAFAANYDGGTSFDLVFSDMNFTVGSRTTKFWVTATAADGEELEDVIEY